MLDFHSYTCYCIVKRCIWAVDITDPQKCKAEGKKWNDADSLLEFVYLIINGRFPDGCQKTKPCVTLSGLGALVTTNYKEGWEGNVWSGERHV